MADKQDIRVTKTQNALAETLMALLEKKPFQKITVNDICTAALVSRSTFYLHFEDKYQLARFCLQREREEMARLVPQMDTRDVLRTILSRIQSTKRLYQNIVRTEMSAELLEMFRDHLRQPFMVSLRYKAQQGQPLCGPADILASYYATGTAGAIARWVESGFQATLEEMVHCVFTLLANVLVFPEKEV